MSKLLAQSWRVAYHGYVLGQGEVNIAMQGAYLLILRVVEQSVD